MILFRPRIAGENVAAAGGAMDGIPIHSGNPIKLTWDEFGPAITHEWFIRSFAATNVTLCSVIEFLWDKRPCKADRIGKCHQQVRVSATTTEATTWKQVLVADPQRFAIIIGSLGTISGQAPTGVVQID